MFLRFEDIEEFGITSVVNRICNWLHIEQLDPEILENLSTTEKNSIDYPPMEDDVEYFLSQFYKKPNEQLYNLIEENFQW